MPGAQGLLSASRGPVRAVHAWGGRCIQNQLEAIYGSFMKS